MFIMYVLCWFVNIDTFLYLLNVWAFYTCFENVNWVPFHIFNFWWVTGPFHIVGWYWFNWLAFECHETSLHDQNRQLPFGPRLTQKYYRTMLFLNKTYWNQQLQSISMVADIVCLPANVRHVTLRIKLFSFWNEKGNINCHWLHHLKREIYASEP